MGKTSKVAVGTWRMYDHEVVRRLDRFDGLGQAGELDRLVVADLGSGSSCHTMMRRNEKLGAGVMRPGAALLDIAGKTPLPRIEIDGSDTLADVHKRYGEMDCDRRFARAALLVSEHDHVRRRSCDCLVRHQRHSDETDQSSFDRGECHARPAHTGCAPGKRYKRRNYDTSNPRPWLL